MSERRLATWQTTTLLTLTFGYAGYYFCRSNLSVVMPLLLDEFGGPGFDKETIGDIASIGVIFYAAGKFFNGVLVDFLGGRRLFLLGMALSVGATIAFGLSTGVAAFMIVWSVNRLVQSVGWVALVKVSSHWFSVRHYGRAMGILCLSFLFGDALAKYSLGRLIDFGVGWRGVFFASAGVLAALALAATFMLRERPRDVGEAEPQAHPRNVYGEKGNETRPESVLSLLIPLLTHRGFLIIIMMNMALTLIRETFNTWTPLYLYEVHTLSAGEAAQVSALFPLFGGVSVLLAGQLTDRLAKGQRGWVMVVFLLPVPLILLALSRLDAAAGVTLPVVLICATALLLLGPYAFLSGVISLDLGGRRGSSTTAGVVDGFGYMGGAMAGRGFGALAQRYGWDYGFAVLAGLAALAAAAAVAYWWDHERRPAPTPERAPG